MVDNKEDTILSTDDDIFIQTIIQNNRSLRGIRDGLYYDSELKQRSISDIFMSSLNLDRIRPGHLHAITSADDSIYNTTGLVVGGDPNCITIFETPPVFHLFKRWEIHSEATKKHGGKLSDYTEYDQLKVITSRGLMPHKFLLKGMEHKTSNKFDAMFKMLTYSKIMPIMSHTMSNRIKVPEGFPDTLSTDVGVDSVIKGGKIKSFIQRDLSINGETFSTEHHETSYELMWVMASILMAARKAVNMGEVIVPDANRKSTDLLAPEEKLFSNSIHQIILNPKNGYEVLDYILRVGCEMHSPKRTDYNQEEPTASKVTLQWNVYQTEFMNLSNIVEFNQRMRYLSSHNYFDTSMSMDFIIKSRYFAGLMSKEDKDDIDKTFKGIKGESEEDFKNRKEKHDNLIKDMFNGKFSTMPGHLCIIPTTYDNVETFCLTYATQREIDDRFEDYFPLDPHTLHLKKSKKKVPPNPDLKHKIKTERRHTPYGEHDFHTMNTVTGGYAYGARGQEAKMHELENKLKGMDERLDAERETALSEEKQRQMNARNMLSIQSVIMASYKTDINKDNRYLPQFDDAGEVHIFDTETGKNVEITDPNSKEGKAFARLKVDLKGSDQGFINKINTKAKENREARLMAQRSEAAKDKIGTNGYTNTHTQYTGGSWQS